MAILTALLIATMISAQVDAGTFAKPPSVLSDPAKVCKPVEYFRTGARDPLMAITEIGAEGGVVYTLFYIADFEPPAGAYGYDFKGGALYFHFDDESPIYEQLPMIPHAHQGYFISLRFARVRRGVHRIAYGLIDEHRKFIAYGQRCFTIKTDKPEFFGITRIMATPKP